MKKQNIREIEIGDDFQDRTIQPFSQIFQIHYCSILHQNVVEIEPSRTKNQEFQVLNRFTDQTGNQLTKITEIVSEDRLIKIIDKFTLILCPQARKSTDPLFEDNAVTKGLKSHKILMERKSTAGQAWEGDKSKKFRDMRSSVKNIFRMFEHWAHNHTKSNSRLKESLTALRNQNRKFNNTLIVNLSKEPLLCLSFMDFCQNKGEEYIRYSKIHDKQSHLDALRVYHKICLDESRSNEPGVKVEQREDDPFIDYRETDKVENNIEMKEEDS